MIRWTKSLLASTVQRGRSCFGPASTPVLHPSPYLARCLPITASAHIRSKCATAGLRVMRSARLNVSTWVRPARFEDGGELRCRPRTGDACRFRNGSADHAAAPKAVVKHIWLLRRMPIGTPVDRNALCQLDPALPRPPTLPLCVYSKRMRSSSCRESADVRRDQNFFRGPQHRRYDSDSAHPGKNRSTPNSAAAPKRGSECLRMKIGRAIRRPVRNTPTEPRSQRPQAPLR